MLKAQDEGLSFLTGHIYRRELHAVFGAVHEIVIAARKKAKFLKARLHSSLAFQFHESISTL